MRRALLAVLLAAATTAPARAEDTPEGHPIDRAPALLEALTPFVEGACGATFPAPPRVVTLPASEAAQIFRDDLRPEIERKYASATDGQKAALLDATARSSVASCLARYSFSHHVVVLVRDSFDRQRRAAGFADDEATDLLRAVLCHEAVHALDDARFDLAAFYAGAGDEESLRARAMVAEGRAVHFGRRAAANAGVAARARDILPGGETPHDVHTWLLRLTYELGAAFVATVSADDPEADTRMFSKPPALTLEVARPTLWNAAKADTRPAEIVARAVPGATVRPLSDLQLRARYASLHGREAADRTFCVYAGGAQAVLDDTNVAVLAFENDDAARGYADLAGDEAPTRRVGTLVLRAFGPAAEAMLGRLVAALRPADDADSPR